MRFVNPGDLLKITGKKIREQKEIKFMKGLSMLSLYKKNGL